jgi:hypothetical protein
VTLRCATVQRQVDSGALGAAAADRIDVVLNRDAP